MNCSLILAGVALPGLTVTWFAPAPWLGTTWHPAHRSCPAVLTLVEENPNPVSSKWSSHCARGSGWRYRADTQNVMAMVMAVAPKGHGRAARGHGRRARGRSHNMSKRWLDEPRPWPVQAIATFVTAIASREHPIGSDQFVHCLAIDASANRGRTGKRKHRESQQISARPQCCPATSIWICLSFGEISS